MTILEALKFVQRGVARRDIIPGLTNFRIADGRVTGFNGVMALSAPVDIGFNAAPGAGHFIRALNACEDVIQVTQQSEDKILVRSGNFKAAVPCISVDKVPATYPEGVVVPSQASVLQAFEVMHPFIGIDASRKWACGILLAGNSAYATNNIVLVEYWLGTPFPYIVNVPSDAVDEVLRIHEEMTSIQLCETSITFHYGDGRWIKSQLVSSVDWPDVSKAMDRGWKTEDGNWRSLPPVPTGLAPACVKLAAFGSKDEYYTHLRTNYASTMPDGTDDGGALVELGGLPDKGKFHTAYLNDVLAVATSIDLTVYPAPVPFAGGPLRGVILGAREA
jgi:hypothetical protein